MRKILLFAVLGLACLAPPAAADKGTECRLKTRKVSCSDDCKEGEERSVTKKCVFSKEKYKEDGIGCVRYDDVCWCRPACPKESGDIKL